MSDVSVPDELTRGPAEPRNMCVHPQSGRPGGERGERQREEGNRKRG